jgi:uncharacterized membrane protein
LPPDQAAPRKGFPLTIDDQPVTASEVAEVEREGRAVSAERQTLFSDAVIAIAITLLALELPLPEGVTNAALWEAAKADHADYLAFLISFVVIWAHWAGHHRLFRYVTGFDARLGTLNTLWLFMQVVTPFATKVIAGEGAFQYRFGFYALVQAASSVLFAMMVLHIRSAGLYKRATPPRVFSGALTQSWVLVAAFGLSIPLSYVTHYSWLAWIAVPVVGGQAARLRSRDRA